MNHQPFEHWILSDTSLPESEFRQLQKHLELCEQCQDLYARWHAARHHLQSAPLAEPTPGFSERWKTCFARHTAQKTDRSLLWLLAILFSLTGVILLFEFGYYYFTGSLTDLIAPIFNITNRLLILANSIRFTVIPVLRNIPLLTAFLFWVFLAKGVFSILGCWVGGACWSYYHKNQPIIRVSQQG